MNDATRGRPQGDVRMALVSMLGEGPAHFRALAERGDLDVVRVRKTLDNMQQRGEVRAVAELSVPGANRPAKVYALANPARGDAAGGINWALIDCWAAWPAQA